MTTIIDYHKDLAEKARKVIPVGGRSKYRTDDAHWNLKGSPEGRIFPTGKQFGVYCELMPCVAVINGREYPDAVYRDGLPFAGIGAAVLIGVEVDRDF